MNTNYYINVKKLMENQKLHTPKCNLPRPKHKPTIYVTGWNEFLPLVIV